MIPNGIKKILEKQGYRIVGKHSAVKVCYWTKKAIKSEDICYKCQFYGIQTHRCVQMTPAVIWCNLRCVFCWRSNELYAGREKMNFKVDEPSFIVEECIKAHKELISGFGGQRLNPKIWKEANNPKHFAVSLSGEPCLYPLLSDLFEEIHKRGMTSFLVTNGVIPEALENLEELPTQLYVSLVAWDRKSFSRITRGNPSLWDKFLECLELMPSLDTRKVIRITAVKDLNMFYPEKYAQLIRIAEPHFVEIKGYMHVGWSQQRLSKENMPSHREILNFGRQLSKYLGYKLVDEKRNSRVCLLAPAEYSWRKIKLS